MATLSMVGCVTLPHSSPEPGDPHPQAATESDEDAREALRSRAVSLWQFRHERNWAALYDYESPERREQITRNDYIPWIEQNYPFQVQDYSLTNVTAVAEMGWVEVTYRAALARFPDLPPRETAITEKWHLVDGRWYPVPPERVKLFPASPVVRDAEQEAKLREQFDLSWQRRQAGDVDALYQMIDPADRALVDLDNFKEGESLHRYLEREIHWVEVVGARGRVNVSITYRIADPSLTKLPPHIKRVTEQWLLRDGQWYRDLADDPREGKQVNDEP